MGSVEPDGVALPAELVPPGRGPQPAWWRRRMVLAAALAMLVIPPFAWIWLARGTAPSDGTLILPSEGPWSSAHGVELQRVIPTAGGLAPQPGSCTLEVGDRVLKINNRTVDSLVRGDATLPGLKPGDSVTYTIQKDGVDSRGTCSATIGLTSYPWRPWLADYFAVLPLAIVMWLISAFVFLQRPRDSAARALFVAALLLPYGATAWPLGTQAIDLANGPRLWPHLWGDLANTLLWGALLHFATVFPRPARWLRNRPQRVVALYTLPFVLHFVAAALREPDHVLDWFGYFIPWLNPGLGLDTLRFVVPISLEAGRTIPFVVAGTIVWQYWATKDSYERQRMRWVNYALLFCACFYLGLGQIPAKMLGHPLVDWRWQPVVFAVLPLTLGAAVLRYGIFDLQIILRRSMVYGALTTTLVLLPAATTIAIGKLAGATPSTTELVLTVALVVVVFHQALHMRLKRRISRLIFGDRDDPYLVIEQLGHRLRSSVPTESLLESIAETVANALRLPYVGIEIVGPDEVTNSASYGAPQGDALPVVLVNQGQQVGRLLLDPGAGREPFGPADLKLVEMLAGQVGIAAHNVQLSSRLQRSLERTVLAREEERRRLRRDIHDGLGPMLAATRMRLQVAHSLMSKDPDAAGDIVDELIHTHQAVLADVRRLVEGLRPPVLDQLGLVSAVRQRADSLSGHDDDTRSLHIAVDATDDVEPLPAAVEVAAYRIVLEALTNVARHAEATRCRVEFRRSNALLIEVEDNGHGLSATYRAGVGLNSMRERAEELGGTCVVSARPGRGTRVLACLPIHSH